MNLHHQSNNTKRQCIVKHNIEYRKSDGTKKEVRLDNWRGTTEEGHMRSVLTRRMNASKVSLPSLKW